MTTDPILDAPRDIQELHRYKHIQQATWRAQRVGWWVLVLITLAGLAGLFGNGPLAKTSTRLGPIEAQYEFILRREADAVITFDTPAPASGRASLTLPASYLDAVKISSIQPEPLAAYASKDGQTFIFAAPEARTRIRLTIRPRHIGWLDFAPQINGHPLPPRSPLVLP